MKTITTALLVLASSLAGCHVTSHGAQPVATMKSVAPHGPAQDFEATLEQPGPVTVEKVVAADWRVSLSGLVNLKHPTARAAGLQDREEAIQIYFYAIRHPRHGLFIVDSGVDRSIASGGRGVASRLLAGYMSSDKMKARISTADWLAKQAEPLRGVLLTHLHFDHILGLPDVPRGVPLYVGAGETDPRRFLNMFVQGSTDRALEGHDLRALAFSPDPRGRFAGLHDLFGDGSVIALHVPGHTAGSMAFVVRTPTGPVLLTGDASHTVWGWQHGVEPGGFTDDHAGNATALRELRALAARHPALKVHLGHQELK